MSAIVADVPRTRQRFFLWFAIAAAIAVLWGFGPTYFFRAFITTRDLNLLIHVHGFLFTSWVVLFVAQTVLVAKQRTDLHRRLGVVGAILAVAVVVAGVAVAIYANPVRQQRWADARGTLASLRVLLAIAYGPLAFAVFAACGVLWRRTREAHKRLMSLATIAVMDAPLARVMDDFGWPIVVGAFGFEAPNGPLLTLFGPLFGPIGLSHLVDLPFWVALAVYDLKKRGGLHPVTLYGGLAFFLLKPALTFFFGLLAR